MDESVQKMEDRGQRSENRIHNFKFRSPMRVLCNDVFSACSACSAAKVSFLA
jgi:hypothetical protein